MGLDGFFFDVESFFASMSVQRMSFAERGVYLVMLFQEWREVTKSLPDDVEGVIETIALTPEQAADVRAAWPKVRRKFVTDRRDAKRIYNVRLEKTRRQQAQNLRKRVSAGRLAGKASAAKRLADRELDTNERSTGVEPSSTVLNVLSSKKDRSKKEPPNPLTGGTVTRADRKLAKEIRKNRFGRCQHDPACDNGYVCETLIAAELAARRAS